jgi:hypothetical protein
MQSVAESAKLAAIRAFTAPARCPHCNDWIIAPVHSEFVEGGEIRHTWECDSCGEISSTVIDLGVPAPEAA